MFRCFLAFLLVFTATAMESCPSTMRAVVAVDGECVVVERPVPEPAEGEILPVNKSGHRNDRVHVPRR